MTDRRSAVAVLLAAALALCACAEAGRERPEDPPPGAGQTFEVLPPPPPVAWSEDGDLAVTTYGSSSCPSGPGAVTVVGEQEVVIDVEALFPDRDPCTADMAPTTTELRRPDGIDADATVTVRLRHPGGDDETVVLPPAGD